MALRATCAFPFYRYRCIFDWIIAASLSVKLESEAQKSHFVANRVRLSLSFLMVIYVFLSSIDRSQCSAFTHSHGIAYLWGCRRSSYRLSAFGRQLVHWVSKTRQRGDLRGAWRRTRFSFAALTINAPPRSALGRPTFLKGCQTVHGSSKNL